MITLPALNLPEAIYYSENFHWLERPEVRVSFSNPAILALS